MGQKQVDHILRELTSYRKVLKTHPWVAEELLWSVLWNLDLVSGRTWARHYTFGCTAAWSWLSDRSWMDSANIPKVAVSNAGFSMLNSEICLPLASWGYILPSQICIFCFRTDPGKPSIFPWLRLGCLSKTQSRVPLLEVNTVTGVSHLGRAVRPPFLYPLLGGRRGKRRAKSHVQVESTSKSPLRGWKPRLCKE